MDRPRRPLHSQDNYIYPDETARQYQKLFGVIGGFILVSLLLTFGRGWDTKYIWEDFVAVFLIVSAAYKIFRLEIFSTIFRSYDLIGTRWKLWNYIYPFVELGLGTSFLLSNGSAELYLGTILFMAITVAGSLLRPPHKTHVQYACLDTIIQLPIASINIIVGVLVIIASLVMLVAY